MQYQKENDVDGATKSFLNAIQEIHKKVSTVVNQLLVSTIAMGAMLKTHQLTFLQQILSSYYESMMLADALYKPYNAQLQNTAVYTSELESIEELAPKYLGNCIYFIMRRQLQGQNMLSNIDTHISFRNTIKLLSTYQLLLKTYPWLFNNAGNSFIDDMNQIVTSTPVTESNKKGDKFWEVVFKFSNFRTGDAVIKGDSVEWLVDDTNIAFAYKPTMFKCESILLGFLDTLIVRCAQFIESLPS